METRLNHALRAMAPRGARFAAVGAFATLTYLAVASFGAVVMALTPMVNNVLAWTISIAVSYFGHNYFTFQAGGNHMRYMPRYLVVTAFLFIATALLTHIGETVLELSPLTIAVVVSLAYPVLSVLMNMIWTFAK